MLELLDNIDERKVKAEELESGLPIFYKGLPICKKPDEGVVQTQETTVSNALWMYQKNDRKSIARRSIENSSLCSHSQETTRIKS